MDEKTWQVRTVTIHSPSGNRFVILPFIIDSGGLSVMVGRKAAAKLVDIGAIATKENPLKLCNVRISLPIKAHYCVVRWSDPHPDSVDHDNKHDIREL